MKLPVTSVESGPLSPRYLGIDPRPARRAPDWEVGPGEDRLDQVSGEASVDLASTRRVQLTQPQRFASSCCSQWLVPASRSSGAIRSERAAESSAGETAGLLCMSRF